MARLIARMLKDQSAATAIEYGLIVGLIAVAIVGGLANLGAGMNAMYTTISGAMK